MLQKFKLAIKGAIYHFFALPALAAWGGYLWVLKWLGRGDGSMSNSIALVLVTSAIAVIVGVGGIGMILGAVFGLSMAVAIPLTWFFSCLAFHVHAQFFKL